jgi:hypothetical protein
MEATQSFDGHSEIWYPFELRGIAMKKKRLVRNSLRGQIIGFHRFLNEFFCVGTKRTGIDVSVSAVYNLHYDVNTSPVISFDLTKIVDSPLRYCRDLCDISSIGGIALKYLHSLENLFECCSQAIYFVLCHHISSTYRQSKTSWLE